MKIERFEMERFQSTWENTVQYNLSESGIHPLTLAGLVDHTWVQEVLSHEPLGYGSTNGSEALRREIAGLHHGAGYENVLVTCGTAEANFLTAWALLEHSDEAVVMLPNYMQIPLLVKAWTGTVREWWLRRDNGRWAPRTEELSRLITPRTKAIFVCNPNNPTGAVLSAEAMNAICDAADRVNAWIVADEVYRGAERDNHPTPSFWDRYPRVVVTGGLSKAYGLPGLRIGWIIAPRDLVETLWAYHDYTTIAPAFLSDRLALAALTPRTRQRLMLRTQQIMTENLKVLTAWADDMEEELSWVPPQAGAIAFFRYRASVNSSQLAERLRKEESVLIVPGDHFRMDGHFRLGIGVEGRTLEEGLSRIGRVLRSL